MDVHASRTSLAAVRDYVERSFRPVAEEKGLDFEIELGGGRARRDRDGRAAAPAGAQEPALERVQVHRARPVRVRPLRPVRRPRDATARRGLRRDRHRHRDPARQAAPDLRGVPAGRGLDQPPLRRHRAGTLDQPRDRAPAGRRDPGREHGGRGRDVHAATCLAASAAPDDARRSRAEPPVDAGEAIELAKRRPPAPARSRCPGSSRTTGRIWRRATASRWS